MKTHALVLSAVCFMLAFTSTAQANAVYGTPISKLPAVIKKPGIYRLAKDLVYTKAEGTAITIEADGVTIDLAGRQLSSSVALGDGSVRNIAIGAIDRQYITICNGRISGFDVGVNCSGGASKGHSVRNLTVQECASGGVFLEGANCVARDSFFQTIGSIQTGAARPTYGVWLAGDYGWVHGNRIANIFNPNPTGTDFYVSGARVSGRACIISENWISGVSNLSGSPAIGAITDGTSNTISIVERNRIHDVKTGVEFGANATGVYRYNTVFGATVNPYNGGGGSNGGDNY